MVRYLTCEHIDNVPYKSQTKTQYYGAFYDPEMQGPKPG